MLTAILLHISSNNYLAPGRLLKYAGIRQRIETSVSQSCLLRQQAQHWLLDRSSLSCWPAGAAATVFTRQASEDLPGRAGLNESLASTIESFETVGSHMLPWLDSDEEYWLVCTADNLRSLLPLIDRILLVDLAAAIAGMRLSAAGSQAEDAMGIDDLAALGFHPQGESGQNGHSGFALPSSR